MLIRNITDKPGTGTLFFFWINMKVKPETGPNKVSPIVTIAPWTSRKKRTPNILVNS